MIETLTLKKLLAAKKWLEENPSELKKYYGFSKTKEEWPTIADFYRAIDQLGWKIG